MMAEEATRTFKEMLLYKLDRTLAIAGVVAITIIALFVGVYEVAIAGVGILGVYAGTKNTAKTVSNGTNP